MTKKQKKMLWRIIIAAAVYAALLLAVHFTGLSSLEGTWYLLPCFAVPYLIAGYDIILKAFRNIAHGQVFDENFLMMLATFGAFGCREFSEAAAVMLFYQVGELFQSYAVEKSRRSISEMMDIVPEFANIEKAGSLVQVDPDEVEIGDVIVIKPGERVPLDGVVVEGDSFLDTSAITGEPVPRKVHKGDEIYSGCINTEGILKVRTTKEFDDSTVSRILELVENASSKKAPMENFITRFARYYTPLVTIGAVVLAFLPPLILQGGLSEWIQRACIFLVISCPCALVISVPLGFFGGIGAASKIGVLVKGGNYLEAMADMKTMVFDKTGTLTKGEFKVTGLHPAKKGEQELLKVAALAEGYSTHPIASAVRRAYQHEGSPNTNGLGEKASEKLDLTRVGDAKEIAGHGIYACIDGQEVLVGNEKLMSKENIQPLHRNLPGTVIHIAQRPGKSGEYSYSGAIVISDEIKEGAKEALASMKQLGVEKCVMLTGDAISSARQIAKDLGIDELHAGLLPADKVECVETLLSAHSGKAKLAFAGDGINDAPVLTRADIGIAMGAAGSDAAIEAADIVLMDDDVRKISALVGISRKTLRIVKQNIVFALGVKALVLVLGALGLANMWEAVFADVGVAVIAILNSMRTLGTVTK